MFLACMGTQTAKIRSKIHGLILIVYNMPNCIQLKYAVYILLSKRIPAIL